MHGTLPITDLFMSAADLGLTEKQRDALVKTLRLLEAGMLVHTDSRYPIGPNGFNMARVRNDTNCGTAACICGWANILSNGEAWPVAPFPFFHWGRKNALARLFFPFRPGVRYEQITPSQAARALRSYLTTGSAKWSEAVAS